jgi:acetyl-CoA carboxylase biotin carboxyl carrier protein
MDEEQLQAVWRLLALVERYQLAELVVEEEGVTVTIRGPEARRAPEWDLGLAETILPETEESAAGETALREPVLPFEDEEMESEGYHRLLSPMTGLFYRSASPEAPSFVEAGDEVEQGQTVGLIEAMKVFSEIPADIDGIVVRILVENGALVTQGEPLMLLARESPPV